MQNQIDVDEIVEEQFRDAPEFILRKKVPKYIGGAVSDKTLANRDSLGLGIKPRLLIAGRVAYPKQAVIEFYRSLIKLDKRDADEA